MWSRSLQPFLQKSKKSILLLGPRQVGKSTLLSSLNLDLTINLALESEYFLFQTNPRELEDRLEHARPRTVFIDEIQRIPRLTHTIQAICDKDPKIKFFLSGSSARKLKRGKANLLPGRILVFEMGPLTVAETEKDWDEWKALSFGSLPGVFSLGTDQERKKLLKSYSQTYLKEEIVAEALVKNTENFARFLLSSSQFAGHFLDLSKLAKLAHSPRQSVVRHFQLLEDTLLVSRVYADPQLLARGFDLVRHPRFYYFDNGVLNSLMGSFDPSLDRLGMLFEHLVFNQVMNSAKSLHLEVEAFNLRTRGGFEIDFIFKIEDQMFAVECKATDSVDNRTVLSVLKAKEFYKKIQPIVIYRGKRSLSREGVAILPLPQALKAMGLNSIN